jgi:MFS family permease
LTKEAGEVNSSVETNEAHMRRVLLSLVGVALLVNYVETMVIPGIPTIQNHFNSTDTLSSWISSAYLITGAGASMLLGKLGDSYGKKKMFLVSLSFYIVGVGVAGFSPSMYFLIFARALQGIGFAIIPLSLAIVSETFPRERIGMAQGIISATFAIGATIGLILGSYVVEDLGWQYAFHTAVVLSLVLFVIVAKVLRKDTNMVKRRMDYLGAAILIAGVTLVLVYITEGPTLGWLSLEELGFLIPGLALAFYFFMFERNKADPLMHLKLLRVRNVLVANMVGIFSMLTMFLVFFAITYYSQLPSGFGLGLTVIQAGLTMGPAAVGMLVVGPLIGKLLPRSGPKPVLFASAGIIALGLAMFILNRATRTDTVIDLFVCLAGMVGVIVPIVNMIAIAVPREDLAIGMGMNTMLRNIGGAIGPVVATSVMSTYTKPLIKVINGHPVAVATLPSAFAFNLVFAIGIALTFCMMAFALATKNYTFKKAESTPPS